MIGDATAAARRRGSRGRLVAVHVRHLAVHEDGVVASASQALDGLERRQRRPRRAARAAQHRLDHALVDRVVLGDQDAAAPSRPGSARAAPAARARVGRLARRAPARAPRSRRRGGPAWSGSASTSGGLGRPPADGRGEHHDPRRRRRGSARIARATSRPSMPGHVQSSSTTSNGRPRAAARSSSRRAAAPSRRRVRTPHAASMAVERSRGWWRCRRRRGRATRRQAARPPASARRRRAAASGSREPERAALARVALSTPISPPISSTSCAADRQAQPGAAVPPRGRASAWVNGSNSVAELLAARCRCRCRATSKRSARRVVRALGVDARPTTSPAR